MNEKKSAYSTKLLDPRWQQMRLKILERDEWMCQLCFDKESTLHVHHHYYDNTKDPWDYPSEALITLCASCHEDEYQIMPGVLQDLGLTLKKAGFFYWDIYHITNGFASFVPVQTPHRHDVTAQAISWALKSKEMMAKILEGYFQSIKGKSGREEPNGR